MASHAVREWRVVLQGTYSVVDSKGMRKYTLSVMGQVAVGHSL